MANTLTILSASPGGTVMQPFCDLDGTIVYNTEILFGSMCSALIEPGSAVTITATPDAGYTIGTWQVNPSPSSFVHDNDTQVTLVMPSEDIEVSVFFDKIPVAFSYSVGEGNGNIAAPQGEQIRFGDEPETFTTTSTLVQIWGSPDTGWKIDRWEINSVVTTDGFNTYVNRIDIPVSDIDPMNVVIYFIQENITNCNTNILSIVIEGDGSVSGEPGEYCDFEEKILNPISSNGYFFKEWIYNDPTIFLNGTSLEFDMSKDRDVTAIFEKIAGYAVEDYTLFYCPSTVSRANTVDFSYSTLSPNPSVADNFHFRATFYADPEKTKTLYSAFSLSDNKRWFYNDGSFKQIPIGGVFIGYDESMDITYSPEVLPAELAERQREESLSSGNTEFNLICGTRYYVDIEAYSQVTEDLTFIKSISLIVDCDDVDAFYSYKDDDKNNWICSGQGSSDLLVTENISPSLFPSISSNHFGIFNIAWQSRMKNDNAVYNAMWDSNNDLLYSSGQGMYDTKTFNDGFRPIVLTDLSSSFYISSYLRDKINYYYCPIRIADEDTPTGDGDVSATRLCYPGQETNLSSTIDNIIVRVFEEDTDDNLVINKDKVIPIVNKTSIRLDIDGTIALYAVRLRDSADTNWSEWINVDIDLPPTGDPPGDDATIDAYKISDSRIIIPWRLDRINGVRRICCQFLTLYGISPTVCIDIFMNIDIIKYVFKFYNDESMDDNSEVPIFNGLPIVSQKRQDNTGIVIGNGEGAGDLDGNDEIIVTDTTIHFEVLFSEDIIIDGLYNGEIYEHGDFTFNMVQQGIDDIWGGVLEKVENNIFKGSFNIYSHDGVFNKDGKAFIQVILTNSIGSTVCLTDQTDPYNLMFNTDDSGRLNNLSPEEVFNQYRTSQIAKTLDTTEFKQYYRIDDDDFRFGNPDFFRNDKQE